uniref:Spt4/RpoE2 zinc finger domain-containing protein n=1 Tax=Timspurckia oligopyrenoides TaxID=708627 RepID=A0A7S0ZLH4_9RHOD|mmetsp:Transcript_9946/g.17913  ORF Transcript_9946/g.17913 Transcript_9946/m.17913 type:complete len:123 (+) Transcript_9946:86-454(+)|eukprot:CAMPEP_0182447688 /NCGR_PEP_ID=MMETSP1172-20130603/18761_1 /TAXON_ID=708627 /ORGANISM="Timspurckia oligopyrenoides, Strain CCMP3278" /LENGTH=122 /DNA_ID=CAMNT_0024644217 /DNA_START=46 /DNA_END=414 /DNA_ORIENTATION=+
MAGDDSLIVPQEFGMNKLRACLSCSLVKTQKQFYDQGCDNCPGLMLQRDSEAIAVCTSNAFSGTYVLLRPKDSWVSKWQRTRRFRPGCYAIQIDIQLPQSEEERLVENGQRVNRIRATANAL